MPRTIPKDIQTRHWQPTAGSTYSPRPHETVVQFTFENKDAWTYTPGDRVLISTADLIRLDYVAQDHAKTRQILGCGEIGLLEKKASFMARQRMDERAEALGREQYHRQQLIGLMAGTAPVGTFTPIPGAAEAKIAGLEAELKRDEQRKQMLSAEIERERKHRLQVERDLAACQKALVQTERDLAACQKALVQTEWQKKRAQEDAVYCRSLHDANRSLGSANSSLSRQVEELKEANDSLAATVRDLQKQAPFKETRFAEVKMLVAVCHNCSRPTDIATLHSNKNQCLDCIPF